MRYKISKEDRIPLVIYMFWGLLKGSTKLMIPYCYLFFLQEVVTERKLIAIPVVILLYLGVYGCKAFSSVMETRVYNKVFPNMVLAWKKQISDKYIEMNLCGLTSFSGGELKERLHDDSVKAVAYLEKQITQIIQTMSVIVTAVILLSMNWILALISFAFLPISFWFTKYMQSKGNKEYDRQRELRAVYQNFMFHNMQSWKDIKSGCLEELEEKQFTQHWQGMGNTFLKAHMCWFINRTFLAFKDVFMTKMGLYLCGGFLVMYGFAQVPILLSFMEYYADFVNNILSITDIVMQRGAERSSLARVEAMQDMRTTKGKTIMEFESLSFQHVDFCYPGSDTPILEDFSIEIKKGERVALMGESGGGKSTILKLIAGILKPDSGQILINHISLEELDPEAIYHMLGIVMQESSLFHLSIRENLLMGNSHAKEEELWEICKIVNLDSFLTSLPLQLDTLIGENGIKLSGGQRQRLLIARTLLHNPQFLIFDEATSALDCENEEKILEMLLKQFEGKTFLMATHRSASVIHCERVVSCSKRINC